MTASANKLFKQSGSDLPFKEWLKREQLKGALDNHESKFFNADGDDDTDTGAAHIQATTCDCKVVTKVIGALVIGTVIGYGVSIYLNKRK